MQQIHFTPSGLGPGGLHKVEIYFNPNNPVLLETFINQPDGAQISYITTNPGVYTIKAYKQDDLTCLNTTNVEVFFPVVTTLASDVDCGDNTYSLAVNLTNPISAGLNVQYGYSLTNSGSAVSNWTANATFSNVPADENTRYFFVRNSQCTQYITSIAKLPCVTCNITISNIQFICN